jgi:hypothetical protein
MRQGDRGGQPSQQGERKQGGAQGHPGEQAQQRSAEDLRVSQERAGSGQGGSGQQQAGGAPRGQQSQQGVYGEGNYQATRDYNRRTRDFIDSGKVEQAARDAAPDTEADAQQMAAAEAEGKRHIKEEDPALTRKAGGRPGSSDQPASRPGKEG